MVFSAAGTSPHGAPHDESEAPVHRRRQDGRSPARRHDRHGLGGRNEIHVVEPSAECQTILSDAHPSLSIGDAPVAGVDAVLAVKPQIAPEVFLGSAVVRVVVDCRGHHHSGEQQRCRARSPR